MQGTCVQSLVQEDSTFRGTTKPMHHSYWTCVLQRWSPHPQSLCSTAREATAMRSLSSKMKGSPSLHAATSAPKFNFFFFFKESNYNRLPQWLSSKKSIWHAGEVVSIPGLGRSPGERNGNPLLYSCLGNPVRNGAWRAAVHGGHNELDTTEQLNNKKPLYVVYRKPILNMRTI